MVRSSHLRMLAILLVCCISSAIQSQTIEQLKIVSLQLDTLASELVIESRFSTRLDLNHSEDQNIANVIVQTLPSHTPLPVKKVNRVIGSPRRLQILFISAGLSPAAAADSEFEICFATLHFVPATGGTAATSSPLCEKGTLLTRANVADELEKQFQVLQKTEKTSEEKNIFASGFTTKGDGGAAEGGAEINLNSNDLGIRGLTAFARLKKATAEGADPKNFEFGLNQRSASLIGRGSLKLIRQYRSVMLDPASSDAQKDAAAQSFKDLLKKRQERILGGVFFDLGAKIEGQALNFDVTNFVGDGMIQLQSRTLKLFGSTNGFMRFRLIPAGVEVGYKVSDNGSIQPPPAPGSSIHNPNWLARIKFGGTLNLFYKNDSENATLLKRFELNLAAVDRYLTKREVMFDEMTMMNTATTRGHKPWYQADFKIFFTDPEEGTPGLRTGFKVTFSKGSLPPVFAETKSFQFGFILESTEKRN